MKQRLFIFGFLILLVAILVGLNAASYTQKEKTPDNEVTPNRSSFNSGATGTQAFYSLLAETGRSVVRWQEPPGSLLTATRKPAVFVITGNVRRQFSDQDTEQLLRWVSEGGRLIVIDREPAEELAVTTADWNIAADHPMKFEIFGLDPSDQKQMTAETAAVKPVQPTVFTAGVNAIQPSKLASSITFERFDETKERRRAPNTVESPTDGAPVVHFASGSKNLLVEVGFGGGKIVFLSDPYIVSNGGIALADNAQLAINLVASGDRLIAFDEYHQGFGSDRNRFLQFFAGTPVVAIFVQAVLLIGFVFYSQSRRFARPVAEPEPDRLSKLEYVTAMAELQSRTRAYDLAIENIYTEFRRRAARLLGLEVNQATSRELALRISERTGADRERVEGCLFKCEEVVRGEPTSKRQTLKLADELRRIEQKLGIARTPRTGN